MTAKIVVQGGAYEEVTREVAKWRAAQRKRHEAERKARDAARDAARVASGRFNSIRGLDKVRP